MQIRKNGTIFKPFKNLKLIFDAKILHSPINSYSLLNTGALYCKSFIHLVDSALKSTSPFDDGEAGTVPVLGEVCPLASGPEAAVLHPAVLLLVLVLLLQQ